MGSGRHPSLVKAVTGVVQVEWVLVQLWASGIMEKPEEQMSDQYYSWVREMFVE